MAGVSPGVVPPDCHIEYLPEWADATGFGSRVEREFEDWIARAAAADPWLREHPPRIEWLVGAVPPAEVPADDPIVQVALGATPWIGRPGKLGGLDNWHDGATLIVEAGIPPSASVRATSILRTRATSRSRSTISSTAARRSPSRRCASAE